MAHEEHHDVPVEDMVGRPTDDEAGHEALGDGLTDGGWQHVDAQLGPPGGKRQRQNGASWALRAPHTPPTVAVDWTVQYWGRS